MLTQWTAAARRTDETDDLNEQAGDVMLRPVVAELRARLAVLNALPKEETMPSPTSPITIPSVYGRLHADVEACWRDEPYDKSVFVMMKFPDRKMEPWKTACLDAVFEAIAREVARHGLVARRADKKVYASSRQLWDNVCVYMLASKYGIAVLEDHVGDDFNPNVALEYGFMLGLGRTVVLLKEQGFKHLRADIMATIPSEFSIAPDHTLDIGSVEHAVEKWLVDIGIPPKRNR